MSKFLFEEITPAIAMCGRGESLYLGIMTHPHSNFTEAKQGRFIVFKKLQAFCKRAKSFLKVCGRFAGVQNRF
ncbi:hypothetical protein AB9N12_14460 [Bacteroides sp. AN502(2024)]|uniref:hypothetical protein n=1 Tax=Bacteroides sp. AN502(2024) TaxID=3160599 RepID=UPI003513BCE9